jgi:cephalosporin hydroxylase
MRIINEIEAKNWRPNIVGWSEDILPFYSTIAEEIPDGSDFIEVGVAHGRSAVYLAERLLELRKPNVKIWCVDGWSGSWFSDSFIKTISDKCANSAELAMLHPVRSEEWRAVQMFKMTSEQREFIAANGLRGLEIAGIFIDSDHSEEGVKNSLSWWADLVASGGIIAGHDYCEIDWPGTVKAVDEYAKRFDRRIERPTRTVWRIR